jgi:predicted Zn-dependent protease
MKTTLKAVCGVALVVALVVALASPAPGFVPTLDKRSTIVQVRWDAFPVRYRINATTGANITGSRSLTQVMEAAFAAWSGVTTASISFASDGAATGGHSSNDEINMVRANLTSGEYATIAGSALGVALSTWDDTGVRTDVDILFNPDTLYSTDDTTPADRIDLQSVAAHEVGHMLGLDHSNILSATMFPTIGNGLSYARVLSMDDVAGISAIYPTAAYLTRGSISGTVRLTSNAVVYGAMVVAVNASGEPVASAMTDPQGNYTIRGLQAGTYSIYAEPMDEPFSITNVSTPGRVYPGVQVQTGFTTRFR